MSEKRYSLKELTALLAVVGGISGFGGASTAFTAIEAAQKDLMMKNAATEVRVSRNESDIKELKTTIKNLESLTTRLEIIYDIAKKQKSSGQ